MRGPSQLKREFVRKWAKGLHVYSSSNKEMSFLERKKAIKLSADVAMAATRTHTTCWGRAVIAEASNDDTSKVAAEHVLGHDDTNNNNINNVMCWVKKGRGMCNNINKKVIRSKKILRKSCAVGRRRKMEVAMATSSSCIIAKRMVKKKTQMLKSLVPGGKLMNDDVFLIQEALDYIISLQVQVNVMRRLAKLADQFVDHRGKGAVNY